MQLSLEENNHEDQKESSQQRSESSHLQEKCSMTSTLGKVSLNITVSILIFGF